MKNYIIKILKKIEDSGFVAYIVGGFVRDFLLNISSKDIDICTNALPCDLKKIFGDNLIIFEQYGACHLKNKKYSIDINTFRKELKYLNNKPIKIEFIDNLKQDLLRRDFTINSLCFNSQFKLIDELKVKQDLENKTIKVIGDVQKKFDEDATRIIKSIRFMCVLNFNLDQSIIKYIQNNIDFLNKINFNKQKEEIDIILESNPNLFINFLKKYNLGKIFGINTDEFVILNSIIGMYAQMKISDKFTFSKKNKGLLKNYKDYLRKGFNIINIYEIIEKREK